MRDQLIVALPRLSRWEQNEQFSRANIRISWPYELTGPIHSSRVTANHVEYSAAMDSPTHGVLVAVTELGVDRRQISRPEQLTEQLSKREQDICAAISMASQILQTAAAESTPATSWQVSELEAKFGLTLAAEAGVILGKASTQATFEVTIKATRT